MHGTESASFCYSLKSPGTFQLKRCGLLLPSSWEAKDEVVGELSAPRSDIKTTWSKSWLSVEVTYSATLALKLGQGSHYYFWSPTQNTSKKSRRTVFHTK